MLGTDPSRDDTDGDGLDDFFELNEGWIVLRHDGSVASVLSDPRMADSDGDGLDDGQEHEVGTDPRDADTDDDGSVDGQESLIGTNPLRPGIGVTVTFAELEVSPPRSGEGNDNQEWKWGFFVQEPGGEFPGVMVSDQFDCPRYDSCICITYYPERSIPLNKSHTLELAPGEALVLSGMIRETHDDRSLSCPNGDTSVYSSANNGDRYMSFIDEPITYEQLERGLFVGRTIEMTTRDDGTQTSARLFIEISINCAGSGRGICRSGSACVTDSDCESDHCDPDPTDPTRQRCVNYCGNGATDAGEACDDGNTANCGTCNASCSETLDYPGCAGGTSCRSNADCASGTCATVGSSRLCTTACGNGWVEGAEACDDGNTSMCGTCNANCTVPNIAGLIGCADGEGCVVGDDCASGYCDQGTCAPLCGNGIVEGGEVCDDGNTQACGGCNFDCSAVNAAVTGCPDDIGCAAATDCASANCADGVCQP